MEEDAMDTIASYEEFNPIVETFAGELKAAIRWEEDSLDDWTSESPEYVLACAEAALIRLRAAVKTHDDALVRDNAVDLGLTALKIAAVQGGL
jgi:hypothetical protein